MKIKIFSTIGAAALTAIFLTGGAGGTEASSASGAETTSGVTAAYSMKNKCDLKAFVKVKSGGLNVRASASKNAEAVGSIPFNKEGTVVHIIADTGDGSGWLQIDGAETVRTQSVFSDQGWVLSEFLAITIIGDSGRVNLLESGKNSEVLTTIPVNTEVRLFGCEGKRALVSYKDMTGWIEPKNQCGSPATLCM